MISSTDEGTQGIHGLEILFQEAGHQLSLYGPSRGDIEDAFAEAGTDAPRNLWHAVIFATVGWAVQQIAQEEGLRSYAPSAEALRDLGVWEELWPALDAHWRPFLEGQVPREEALVGLANWFQGRR